MVVNGTCMVTSGTFSSFLCSNRTLQGHFGVCCCRCRKVSGSATRVPETLLGPLNISIEFTDSQAHFLVVAEHCGSWALGVATQLRSAGISSLRASACQDTTTGRHASVGVVSL